MILRGALLAAVFVGLMAHPIGSAPQFIYRPSSESWGTGTTGMASTGIPDFCASPTKTAVATGNWTSAGTWSPSGQPSTADVVLIPVGYSVTMDANDSATAIECIGIKGRLIWPRNATTAIKFSELIVYGEGMLDIGTTSSPVLGSTRLIMAGTLDTGTVSPGPIGSDPEQFGVGVIGIGTVRVHGVQRAQTWYRLTEEVTASETALNIEGGVCPTGWASGDRLILPESRHHRTNLLGGGNGTIGWEHLEELTYSSCSGGTITTSAAAYDHPGARDMDGTLVKYPHISNQTRNIVFESANPSGVRGHTMFTERANVDIRYAAFEDLGRTTFEVLDCTLRTTGTLQGVANSPACTVGTGAVTHVGTNHIGRYPLHVHHLTGPSSPQSNGYQFTLVGNAISDAERKKWGIAIHGSHWGLVQWNTMYDIWGAQLATEDGSESYNVIEYNSAIRGSGVCSDNETIITPEQNCDGDTPEPGQGWTSAGRDGVGFWFRGGKNYVRHNIAANFYERDVFSSYGFKHYARDIGTVLQPTTQGVPASTSGTSVDGNAIPILQFEDNEVYASSNGWTYWWICAADNTKRDCDAGTSKDLTAWHFITRGIYAYPSNGMTIDGYTAYGDTPGTQGGEGSAILAGDYMQRNWVLRNLHIEGYRTGFFGTTMSDEPATTPPVIPALASGGTVQSVSDSYFRNTINIHNPTLYTSGSCQQCIPSRITALNNVTFGGGTNINMSLSATGNYIQNDRIIVTDYDGTPGDNFTVYYEEAAASTVLAQKKEQGDPGCSGSTPTVYCIYSTPDSGKTNAQNWTDNGVALGGEVPSCSDTSLADVTGITCPSTGVAGLTTVHREGQTFLTFAEVSGAAAYYVYRETSPITTVSGKTPVATLDEDSGLNLHTSDGFIIEDEGAELDADVGLLVWTTASSGTYYYAVTSDLDTTTVTAGINSSPSGVVETNQDAPGCVLQAAVTTFAGNDVYPYLCWEDYSTWNHAQWGLYANLMTVYTLTGKSGGTDYPLIFVSHSAGECNNGWTTPPALIPGNIALTTLTSQGSHIVTCDNYFSSNDPYTGATRNTSYDIGHYTTATDRVSYDTENRYRRYIKFVRDTATFQVDDNRIYAMGASRGGGGAMHFAARNADLIAAASVAIGWVDVNSGLNYSPMTGETMVGNARTFNQEADQAYLVANETLMPPIMYFYGSNDGTVSPNAYPALFTAYETKNTFFWAAEWMAIGHTTNYLGSQFNWASGINSAVALDVLRFKLNESYPAISSASSNDSPGTSGSLTAAGQINRYIDWHSSLRSITGGSAITDTSTAYGISLISTRGSSFTADVTIQNTQSFNPTGGQAVNWSYSSGGSGSVSANADGSVTIPSLTIGTSAARLTLSYP